MPDQLEICPVDNVAGLEQVRELAQLIWREHYPGIITKEQVEYMLERMYAPDAMRRNWQESGTIYDRAFLGGELVGYSAYGPDAAGGEVKLHSLYVRAHARRAGVGGRLVNRAAEFARSQGFASVVLTVNKDNKLAIQAYRRYGFTVREAIVTDIGGGFVMDDYLLELRV